jgi:tetratricopeptide (TPR) repeat protein
VTSPSSAHTAAARADVLLALGQTKDAAYFALAALAIDDRSRLAWSVVARILSAVSPDALATLTARWALELDGPLEPAHEAQLGRHHRIDLWTRGLLRHESGEALLASTAFDDPSKLQETPDLAPWLKDQLAEWSGNLAIAAAAARKMVAALSDAMIVPRTDAENPLRTDAGWVERPEFTAFRAQLEAEVEKPLPHVVQRDLGTVSVLSDHWMAEEVLRLAEKNDVAAALERTDLWAKLRPGRVVPLAAKVRILDAAGDEHAREEAVRALLMVETSDLNDLEEARVALGELRLWQSQLAILDRMERIAGPHPVIWANRGVAHIELGDHDRGMHDLERALELDPDNGPALANLGLEKMRRDEYAAARELLERAVRVSPEEASTHIYLAACMNNQGDRAGGIRVLEAALARDPANAKAKQLLEELQSP